MDPATKTRLVFATINMAWSALFLALAATLSVLGFLLLGWGDAWPYVVFGAIAGAAIGSVTDSRIFQTMVGATGIVLLAFALYWSEFGGVPEEVMPLVGAALIAFGTLSSLTRVWGRKLHIKEPTLTDLDAAVSRPHTG